ncbi:MAG: N-acetylmuramoyl-L-alanine amidase [Firmicutes bacterium]|nr:N-acetylmuramoyl-L-alanine amidase [Bacillota bacterium]
MKYRNVLMALLCLLALSAAGIGAGCTGSAPGVEAEHLWVYGESALIAVAGPGRLTLEGSDGEHIYEVTPGSGALVDQGLLLWQLQPGRYRFFWDGEPLCAGSLYLPEGYTLPRREGRRHWRFEKDKGLLILTVTAAEELPRNWYDVIVDAGHGGRDHGAEGGGYTEAELNLDNALELAEDLRELGLSVGLTRDSRQVPGGAEAEDDPYAEGARVELIYDGHAPYLLSCHLNASEVGEAEGFQIYCSVAASTDWAEAVADALRQAGAPENNGGKGLVGHGVYQRRAEYGAKLRDYYFILRETGGWALSPVRYLARRPEMKQTLSVGAQGLLLEFAFMDNETDLRRWLEQRETQLAATAAACAAYWQL